MLRPKAETTFHENKDFLTLAHPDVKSLALGEDHWVRMIYLDNLQSQYKGRINGEHTGKELFTIGTQAYGELRDKYHVNMPFNFLLIDDPAGRELLVTVVDKVDGVDINHMQKEKINEFSLPINSLYENISQYFLDKLREGGFFLTDICGPSQYVIGTIPARKQEAVKAEIYLIDADLYLDNRKASLPLTVYWLTRHLSWIEYRLDSKMTQTRENIAKFLSEFKVQIETISEKNLLCLSEIQNFLDGKPFGDPILPAIPTFDGA